METRIELNKNIEFAQRKEMNFTRELTNDIVLPDYCDDINRIIRVDAKPVIKNKYANRDTARLNGIVAVSVVYISDPHKQLRTFTFSSDFDHSLDMSGLMSEHRLSVAMEIGEVNCRLLNPRKMTLRIEFGINVKSSEAKTNFGRAIGMGMSSFEDVDFNNLGSLGDLNEPIEREREAGGLSALNGVSAHEGIQVEKLKRVFEICDTLCGDGEARIEDNIAISGPAASEIIYHDVCAVVEEVKAFDGKAAVKFTTEVKLLYSSIEDRNEYITITKSIAGTHIIDIDGLGEDYQCTAKAILSSFKSEIDLDEYGDNKIVNVDFTLQIDVSAYKNDETEVVVDAYATKFENSVHNEMVKISRFRGIYRDTQKIEDSIELEDALLSMEEVMDIAGIIVTNSVTVGGENGAAVITSESSAELSIMVRGGGEIREIQEIACSIPLKSEVKTDDRITDGSADVIGQITAVEAFIDTGKLTVRATVTHEYAVFESEVCNMARALIIDPEIVKTGKKDVQMTIYYPNKTESLWSVAKRYDSQVSKIMKYNKLESSNISDRKILIIPRV